MNLKEPQESVIKSSSIKKRGDKQKVVANKVLDEDVIGKFFGRKKDLLSGISL